VGFLRPERRFAHLEALKAQIARDIAAAEKALF
jgi:FAD synthase